MDNKKNQLDYNDLRKMDELAQGIYAIPVPADKKEESDKQTKKVIRAYKS